MSYETVLDIFKFRSSFTYMNVNSNVNKLTDRLQLEEFVTTAPFRFQKLRYCRCKFEVQEQTRES